MDVLPVHNASIKESRPRESEPRSTTFDAGMGNTLPSTILLKREPDTGPDAMDTDPGAEDEQRGLGR